MEYRVIGPDGVGELWPLHRMYKEAIGEDAPTERDREARARAIADGRILFFGAWDGGRLVGCCSVTVGFSTFCYGPSGVFEDFFILPEWRHRGIARALTAFARQESGVAALTVGCADCDRSMYEALGFSVPLGNLMAFD